MYQLSMELILLRQNEQLLSIVLIADDSRIYDVQCTCTVVPLKTCICVTILRLFKVAYILPVG